MDRFEDLEQALPIMNLEQLRDREPAHALVNGIDLVVILFDKDISVLYGRCQHRGALLADGFIEGKNLICGLHNWDYRYDTGISEYNNEESLYKFRAAVSNGMLYVDAIEINEFLENNPQPFNRAEYLGSYADTHPEDTEPFTGFIQELAKNGLKSVGKHGPSVSMGVERMALPVWDDIQYLPAQLHKKPLEDKDEVGTETIIGPAAKNPLKLEMPIFVSDMSFGALSKEAKLALSLGAQLAGTGICSGEGGMLDEEKENNQRYLYEFASGEFGFTWEKIRKVQAFHFKAGQGAKSGTGGHLPGRKVTEEIGRTRGLRPGQDAISPATFKKLKSPADFREMIQRVKYEADGIPVGFKMAAGHIERDIDFAVETGCDYIILDGRGGGTGSSPAILRDHINVPTIPALARARVHLEKIGAKEVSLIITGGLRTPTDIAKALMMGADAVALANSALQAIGCLGMRACNSNNCPVGIATQKESLRSRLIVHKSAERLYNFLDASNELIKVIARACGHSHIKEFNMDDLTTFNYDISRMTGIRYGGITPH